MGTSKSSAGSPSGVPMVPPWVPPIPESIPDIGPNPEENPEGGEETQQPTEPQFVPLGPSVPALSPKGRFGSTRRGLGNFVKTGDAGDLKKSLGNYVRKGYGGANTAVRRMGKTVSVAGALFSAFSDLSANDPALSGTLLDPNLLRGKTSKEVMDAIVETVCPSDGTQDAEAARRSVNDALSELLSQFPNADQTQLSDEQKSFVIEKFVAIEVFQRFSLDVGKVIVEKASSPTDGAMKLKQVKDYIKQCVESEFRKLREKGFALVRNSANQIVAAAIFQTYKVFESYL